MKRLINIMQIVLSLECGGLEKIAINLAERLNNRKFRTIICCLDKLGELAGEAEEKGIEVILVKRKRGKDFLLPFRLANVMQKKNIHLVHTHNLGPLLYSTLAAKLAGVPVVINTRHGREKKHVNSFIWNMNDTVVAISEDAKQQMLKWNRIDYAKMKVIYNGIDVNKYSRTLNSDEARRKLNINHKALLVGTVARLSPEKDQFTLIDTFSKVVSKVDNTILIFVGDGILKEELKKYANDMSFCGKVMFLGYRNNVSEVLPAFDVFVLSSLTEGISLTLLEAMAAKRPVVATDVGGNPEVVEDRKTGFLVPAKKSDKMSEAIITLLKNKELAKQMGEAGRKRVEEKFGLDKMVKEYENLYDYWLQKKGVI